MISISVIFIIILIIGFSTTLYFGFVHTCQEADILPADEVQNHCIQKIFISGLFSTLGILIVYDIQEVFVIAWLEKACIALCGIMFLAMIFNIFAIVLIKKNTRAVRKQFGKDCLTEFPKYMKKIEPNISEALKEAVKKIELIDHTPWGFPAVKKSVGNITNEILSQTGLLIYNDTPLIFGYSEKHFQFGFYFNKKGKLIYIDGYDTFSSDVADAAKNLYYDRCDKAGLNPDGWLDDALQEK